VDAPREYSSDDITRLGTGLNDLGSILALPASWAGAEPSQIVSTLADTLLEILHLSFVFVRLSAPDGTPSLEIVRIADSSAGKDRAREIRDAIDASLGDASPKPLSRSTTPVGKVDLSVASARLGLDGEIAIIVAGSHRPDFPAQTERLFLDIAANQATIGLQHAYLAEQRRAAQELDERVAQRTRELALANEALREREHDSRLLVHTIPGLVAILTPAGEVDVVNDELVEYCGQPLEAMKQWGTNGTVHPGDIAHVGQVFTQAIASGNPYDFEARIRRFDGVYHWCQVRGLPFRDPSGRILHWYVLLSDIDDRKRAENALRESERESRQIVDSIPGLIAAFTPGGELEFVNRPIFEYFGKTLAELKRWGTGGMTHPEDLPRVVELFTQSIASGEPFEIELRARRFDGVYRWFQSRGLPLRDTNGHIVLWYNLLIDITERKQAEEELRRSEAFLAEGQQLSRVGSFSWRVATDEITWSEQLYRIFGIDRDMRVTLEVIGTRIHPEDVAAFTEQIERSRRDGSDVQLEIRLQMPDGTVKCVHVVAHRRKESSQLEYIGAVQDVTQRRLSEEALAKVRSELAHVARASSLGVLTASIAHEVNQPLAGIVTNAGTCLRMLGADPPDVDGARETARRTIRDGNRASDVMTRLRALFSKTEFSLESVDVNAAAQEVLALSLSDLQRHRVILQSELADDLPTVTGDRIQLQQVILNLIRNASEAMVEVHGRPRLLLIKTEREDDNRVRLSVRDTGMGLSSQSFDSLFDAFHTTKSGGMGIGLFVSRSIVERHQGRLWAEPNDGPGTTFSFSVPAVRTA
jgi:PAS domain S-box-containing protein